MLKIRTFFYFIIFSIKYRINPFAFFQLNAEYFNSDKKIYSKHEIEKNIPKKYRLYSKLVKKHTKAKDIEEEMSYPIFLKPEWGQNSRGVFRADNRQELKNILKKITREKIPYLYQEASQYKDEFDILYIKDPIHPEKYTLLSITKICNNSDEAYPINVIKSGVVRDITNKFTAEQLSAIYKKLRSFGDFRLVRVSLKADSIADINSGKFQVFEMNIFLPLLPAVKDKTLSIWEREKKLIEYTKELSLAIQQNPNTEKKNIFLNMLRRNFMIQITNNRYVKALNAWVYKKIEEKFMNGCSDYNPKNVRRNTRSKEQGRNMFEKL